MVCEEAHCAALSLLQSVVCAVQPDDNNVANSEEFIPAGLRTCLVSFQVLFLSIKQKQADAVLRLLCIENLSH